VDDKDINNYVFCCADSCVLYSSSSMISACMKINTTIEGSVDKDLILSQPNPDSSFLYLFFLMV
jgi:hypothetical protein